MRCDLRPICEKPAYVEAVCKALSDLSFDRLPIFTHRKLSEGRLELNFICHQRTGTSRFFYDMVTQWLVPDGRIDVSAMCAFDFTLPQTGDQRYTLAQLVLEVTDQDLETVQRNIPNLERELSIGAESNYKASRILEVKGVGTDDKTCLVQQCVADMVRRRPTIFGTELFVEMQQLSVMSSASFRQERNHRHLTRLIGIFYHFRRQIRQRIREQATHRHMEVKVIRSQLRNGRRILGVVVAVNLLCESELFRCRHLLAAIRNHLPKAQPIKESFLALPARDDGIHLLYLEVEGGFSNEQINALQRGLVDNLKGCVEQRMHMVFMPRNDEEIMRHILTLSNQVKLPRDLPCIIISFAQQTEVELCFNVVLVRVMRSGTLPLQALVRSRGSSMRSVVDTRRVVGYVRKRYAKEAAVLRIYLRKAEFLRQDHSLDLYRARQAVVGELERLFGDFRDYYGGMIAKQQGLLEELKGNVGPIESRHELLLENFFHSITPAVMRTIVAPSELLRLFQMLLDALEMEGTHFLTHTNGVTLGVVVGPDFSLRTRVWPAVDQLQFASGQLARFEVKTSDAVALGFILRSGPSAPLVNAVEEALEIEHLEATG